MFSSFAAYPKNLLLSCSINLPGSSQCEIHCRQKSTSLLNSVMLKAVVTSGINGCCELQASQSA